MSFATDKCYQSKPAEVRREWYTVDADGKVLGRMATKIATVLMGKHKPSYTPHVDCGDFVVVTNARKVALTGNKAKEIEYASYSYYPGGRKVVPFEVMHAKHPDRVIRDAVRRMLPKNALARRQLTKLRIYADADHPHQAQLCRPLDLEKI